LRTCRHSAAAVDTAINVEWLRMPHAACRIPRKQKEAGRCEAEGRIVEEVWHAQGGAGRQVRQAVGRQVLEE